MSKPMELAILKCSKHGYTCICIQDESGGHRITDGKCCGSWDVTVKAWPIDKFMIDEIRGQLRIAQRRLPRDGVSP